ncbi:MAG: hypothetical protein KDE33_20480, partial [Bacteroidetes bacterium]|nr:hypothetical protein [Bacteroidota bacterium]
LTADGKLQRCLYREDNLIDLKPFLKTKNPEISKSIYMALETFKNSVFHPKAWSPDKIFMQ